MQLQPTAQPIGSLLPPIVTALLHRSLIRVALRFAAKGCPRPPAAIHLLSPSSAEQWRADRSWAGGEEPADKNAPQSPAGAIIGFVTNGGYDRLQGRGVAIAFCAAAPLVELLGGSSNVGARPNGPVRVLVRNASSRMYRPALVTVCS